MSFFMLYFPRFLLRKIPIVTSSMIFNKWFFTQRIQYLFFITFKSLLLFKSLIATTVEVYKFHALINRNKEKNTPMELQCSSSKITIRQLQTTDISFVIFGQNEFS